MKREKVESSNIAEIGWQHTMPGTNMGVMEVLFKDGSLYHYMVTKQQHAKVMKSESKGHALNELLENSKEPITSVRLCDCYVCIWSRELADQMVRVVEGRIH